MSLVRVDIGIPYSTAFSNPMAGTYWRPYLDLFAARARHEYDKWGSRMLVSVLKSDVLGNARLRMTERRCEEFFDDLSHFVCDDECRWP